jgi:hypothetical protein
VIQQEGNKKREAKKRNKNVRGDRTKKLSGRLC